MVGDADQVAGSVGFVNPAAGVGENKMVGAKQGENPRRQNHVFQGMPFVMVEAPLEDGNFHSLGLPQNEPSLVAFNACFGKVGNIAIGNDHLVFYLVDVNSKSRTQHDADSW